MLEFVDSGSYFVKKYRIRRAKNERIRPDSDPHPCILQYCFMPICAEMLTIFYTVSVLHRLNCLILDLKIPF